MYTRHMEVTKISGEKEAFDSTKLCDSIRRAGAPDELAENVCTLVEQKVTPDVSTSQIFRKALGYLVKENLEISARYSLRRALAMLGPAGFLFEQYVEALVQAHGYETARGTMMKGNCVDHEIDVFATKGQERCLIEAKYRNHDGTKTHIDDVMYADARFIDIASRHTKDEKNDPSDYHVWVVTNTKFTDKAIKYGRCRRMKLIGWNYPGRGNLEDMIIEKKMYPVTVLPAVSSFEVEKFAARNMILARDLLPFSEEQLIDEFGVPPEIARKILEEVNELVSSS